MERAGNKVSIGQLFLLIIHMQIGVGLLSLPHDVFLISKGDGWISTFLAGLIVQVNIFVIWALCRKYPHLTFYEFVPLIIGKAFGKTLMFFYTLYYASTIFMFLVLYGNIINLWIFPMTPKWIIIALMLITACYLAVENLQIISRFLLLTTGLILVLFILVFIPTFNGNVMYILPIGQSGMKDIVEGMYNATYSFIGFDTLLIIYAYVQGNGKAILKTISLANGFVTLFYTFLVFSSLIFFSPEEMALVPQPVLYMLKSFSFKIIERTDLVFLSFWMAIVLCSAVIGLFVTSLGAANTFGLKGHRKVTPLVCLICFVFSIIPRNEQFIITLGKYFRYNNVLFVLILPLFLLVIAMFQQRRKPVE